MKPTVVRDLLCVQACPPRLSTRSLRYELKPDGIHVMSVIPGIVNTCGFLR